MGRGCLEPKWLGRNGYIALRSTTQGPNQHEVGEEAVGATRDVNVEVLELGSDGGGCESVCAPWCLVNGSLGSHSPPRITTGQGEERTRPRQMGTHCAAPAPLLAADACKLPQGNMVRRRMPPRGSADRRMRDTPKATTPENRRLVPSITRRAPRQSSIGRAKSALCAQLWPCLHGRHFLDRDARRWPKTCHI